MTRSQRSRRRDKGLYKRIGYVVISQPRFSRRADKLSLSPFRLVVVKVLAQSVPAMITFNRPMLFSVRQVAGDRPTVTNGRSLLHSYIHAGDSVCTTVWFFFAYKKFKAELRRELVTGCTVRRYDQLETSCDLHFANTDRQTENYSIICTTITVERTCVLCHAF